MFGLLCIYRNGEVLLYFIHIIILLTMKLIYIFISVWLTLMQWHKIQEKKINSIQRQNIKRQRLIGVWCTVWSLRILDLESYQHSVIINTKLNHDTSRLAEEKKKLAAFLSWEIFSFFSPSVHFFPFSNRRWGWNKETETVELQLYIFRMKIKKKRKIMVQCLSLLFSSFVLFIFFHSSPLRLSFSIFTLQL